MNTPSIKTFTMIAAAGSLAVVAAPAQAAEMPLDIAPAAATTITIDNVAAYGDPPPWARAHGRRDRDRGYYYDDDDDDRYERRRYRDRRVYDDRGRYYEPRRIRRGDRIWRGRDGRYYCERENGTTGLIVGAGVGALLGRVIDRDGDRTVGTVLGGALGAVLGREIERSGARCR